MKENEDRDYKWTSVGRDFKNSDKTAAGNLSKSSLNRNNFATLTGNPSALINGFTNSYIFKESINGEKCCRPIKARCSFEEGGTVCNTTIAPIKCGKGCSLIIKDVQKLENNNKEKTVFHSK